MRNLGLIIIKKDVRDYPPRLFLTMNNAIIMAFFLPWIDWIQLEVTTRCNASCVYCPKSAAGNNWIVRDMPVSLAQRILSFSGNVPFVHLQGWGEPLLHPDFVEILRLAKQAGCKVGTTTNGMPISLEMAKRLVGEGLDILAFSIAGITSKRNDGIRRGTRLTQVLRAIEMIRSVRDQLGMKKPKIHMAFMLLRSGLYELDSIPKFLAEAGIEEIVLSPLTLPVCHEFLHEAILAENQDELSVLLIRLEKLRSWCIGQGIEFFWRIISPFIEPVRCSENPINSAVISALGEVHPCMPLSLSGVRLARHSWEGHWPIEKLSFGILQRRDLKEIWGSKLFRSFRRAIRKGKFPDVCQGCLNRYIISPAPSTTMLVPHLP